MDAPNGGSSPLYELRPANFCPKLPEREGVDTAVQSISLNPAPFDDRLKKLTRCLINEVIGAGTV
jgi:hypothetical protein